MSHIFELFNRLEKSGVKLELMGDQLKISILHDGDPAPALMAELKERKAEIIAFLRQTGHYRLIPVQEKREYYPLSSVQRRMVALNRIDPQSVGYNISGIYKLEGEVDIDCFTQVFRQLIGRHESLRTSFFMMDEEPVQRVLDKVGFELEVFRAAGQGGRSGRGGQELIENIIRGFIRPFDLGRAPLLRVGLIHTDETRHILMFDMHHIVSDGVSIGLLIKDFVSLAGGQTLPPITIQYKDFAGWQNSPGQRQVLKEQELFWLDKFKGDIPVLELPSDFPRPMTRDFTGDHLFFGLAVDDVRSLREIAGQTQTTMTTLFLGIFFVFLSKLSGQEDIVIGTPVAGRQHADLQDVIGMFVNTLALRAFPTGDRKWLDFLTELNRETVLAFQNQDYPFEELVDRVIRERDMGRNPLFDVMFTLQDTDRSTLTIGDLKLASYPFETDTAKFDLILTLVDKGETISGNFEYSSRLFMRETIERYAGYFTEMVRCIVGGGDIYIKDINMIPQAELERIKYEFNATDSDYPRHETIPGLFADQVHRTPDRLVLSGETVGANGHSPLHHALSYSGLDQRSDDLAQTLIEKGVLPNTIVGIQIERSIEMIIGIMGILKSGGAYLPIDPELPPERIDYMLADSGAEIVIGPQIVGANNYSPLRETGLIPLTPNPSPTEGRGAAVERSAAAIPGKQMNAPLGRVPILSSALNLQRLRMLNRIAESPQFVKPQAKLSTVLAGSEGDWCVSSAHRSTVPTDLAYVIYTSGSTGQPKGVPIDHGSLVNLCSWHNRTFTVTPDDHASQFASQCFDASVWEIFPYLVAGACLTIVPSSLRSDIAAINTFFEKYGITIAFLPTQAAELFMDLDNRSLRLLLTGGDKLRRLRSQRYKLVNNYGPTENTVVSTSLFLDEKMPDARLPIGRPIDNTGIFILSRWGSEQPVGIAGELWISGPGLARGYLNNPELTAEKFRPSPPFIPPLPSLGEGGDWWSGAGASRCERGAAAIPGTGMLNRIAESPQFVKPQAKLSTVLAGSEGDWCVSPAPDVRMYKTGDLARWLDDGTVEFLGRIDFQVKIRGYRIELGEIESQLSKHPAIKEAVVLARDAEAGEKYLCAYLVIDPAKPTEIQAIRDFLAKKLPAYMVPAHFVCLEQLPLIPNGKVDRKSLPEPQTALEPASYIPPQDEIEWGLAEIWAEILGIEKNNIGTDRNFFEMGGHSLKATRLIARINKRFAVHIPLSEIFKISPTIKEIAAFIRVVRCMRVNDEPGGDTKEEFLL